MGRPYEYYLPIEHPDTKGVMDFISDRAVVEVQIVDEVVHINVKISHGGGSSSWDEQDFEVPIPPLEDES